MRVTDDAFATLSEKLSTPLQFEYYLTRALEEAYKVGQKSVETDMIENVLAKDINGLEHRLTRQGYNAKVLAELLNAKPREIKSFLSGHLAPGRAQDSYDKQYVRDYLEQIHWNKQPPAPALPPDVARRTSEKYLEAYFQLTGRQLDV